MRIKNALQQFGLTEKQTKIYLAVLELGSAQASVIASKANIPRATCYDVLESLREQGIVSRFTKKKTRYYSVEDPRKILRLAEEKTKNLQKVLPDLEALFFSGESERPRVRFFQGSW